MSPFAPLDPEQATALALYAVLHGPGWKDELRAAWMIASAEPILHRLRNTHGPAWLAAVRLEAQEATPRPDFTAHAHPVLAVPCPICGRRAGAWCRKPSGHHAQRPHRARAAAADGAFVAQHGDAAAIRRGPDGRWVVDRHGRARD